MHFAESQGRVCLSGIFEMDNLDALLNELHQTNVEILKRNQASSMFQDYLPTSEHRKPQETEIDLCPSPSSTSPSPSSKFPIQVDPRSRNEQTPRRNMQELEQMLGLLDQPEYTNLVINGSNYRYDDFARQKSNASSSSNERKTSTNSQATKFPMTSPDDSAKNTRMAAEMAAQQLDDLLVSLNQFKV
ncbi:hypothetical protein EG68_04619 [Paragonimus skrjabini miyazakii]|uniref:Uncharacterized protein n=1 Tax=Paragonimus skrjabini miyazakii TaxID=59628 RepID=A0A8S9Z4N9_9TREM|nr:hypothetical protein EG68_04619 [Paragonimus skrjabini miyazakii]